MPDWNPPFALHRGHRQIVRSADYNCTARHRAGPARVLIKHTLAGCGQLSRDRGVFDLPQHHAMVIHVPGDCAYRYPISSPPGRVWSFEYLSITQRVGKDLLPGELILRPVVDLTDQPAIRQLLGALVDHCIHTHQHPTAHAWQAYQLLDQLCNLAIGHTTACTPADLLKEQIDRRHGIDCVIADLAESVGYSHEAATRLFSATFGISPRRYANRCRIQWACHLMTTTTDPLPAIARDCGFADTNYFGRLFKRQTGTTPAAYRRNPDPLRWQF